MLLDQLGWSSAELVVGYRRFGPRNHVPPAPLPFRSNLRRIAGIPRMVQSVALGLPAAAIQHQFCNCSGCGFAA